MAAVVPAGGDGLVMLIWVPTTPSLFSVQSLWSYLSHQIEAGEDIAGAVVDQTKLAAAAVLLPRHVQVDGRDGGGVEHQASTSPDNVALEGVGRAHDDARRAGRKHDVVDHLRRRGRVDQAAAADFDGARAVDRAADV